MSEALDPETIQAAVRIADGCTRSDIEILGIEVAPGQYALTRETKGCRARHFNEAGERLREAVSYLMSRRLALMRLDAEGPVVVLRLDRFAVEETTPG